MNAKTAINAIRNEFTHSEWDRIHSAVQASPNEMDYTLPGFCLWRQNSPERLVDICKRRAIGSTNKKQVECMQERIAFLEAAITGNANMAIWQAYLARGDERNYFVIDASNGGYCSGPYP